MSAKGDQVAALVNELKDLHLTRAGRNFLIGYLAEHDPDAFRAALDTLIKVEAQHGHLGRLTGDTPD